MFLRELFEGKDSMMDVKFSIEPAGKHNKLVLAYVEGTETPYDKDELIPGVHDIVKKRYEQMHAKGKTVVGHVFIVLDGYDGRDVAFGEDLAVQPRYRRLGLATRMYDFAEKEIGEPLYQSELKTDQGEAFWSARRKKRGLNKLPPPPAPPSEEERQRGKDLWNSRAN
jgi:GNAT superfamily N-acetyltransferase